MRGTKGFSIPELLVASTLTIVVAGWMVSAYIASYANWERARIHAELQQIASIYMQRITRGMSQPAFGSERDGLQEAEELVGIVDGGSGIEYRSYDDVINMMGDFKRFYILDFDGDPSTTNNNYLAYLEWDGEFSLPSRELLVRTCKSVGISMPNYTDWLSSVTFTDWDGTGRLIEIAIVMSRPFRGQDITTQLETTVFLRN